MNPRHSLKKEAKVYLVDSNDSTGELQYLLDISEINFSQVIKEESIPVSTIHSKNYFEASKISKANPANFNLVMPALREEDLQIVFNRLLDFKSFSLYIATERDVFKLEKAVITNGEFIIERLRPLSIAISGEASKLSLVGDIDSVTIPGTPQIRSSTRTYNRISYLSAALEGTSNPLDSGISQASIIIENRIKWLENNIVDPCGSVPSLNYPTEYVIESRDFYGSIVQYLTEVNPDIMSYNINTTFNLEVGEKIGATLYGFSIAINNCSYTSTLTTGEIFTQTYNWRMIENPTNLSNVITYNTL